MSDHLDALRTLGSRGILKELEFKAIDRDMKIIQRYLAIGVDLTPYPVLVGLSHSYFVLLPFSEARDAQGICPVHSGHTERKSTRRQPGPRLCASHIYVLSGRSSPFRVWHPVSTQRSPLSLPWLS